MSSNGHAVLGIDVGLDGALAFYRNGCWMVCDMPTAADGHSGPGRHIGWC